jgi:hypothetical protein
MPISTQDAAAALDDIALTQRRASTLLGYERGAPHFLLWGAIWILGYGLSDVVPEAAGVVWLVLDALGITGSVLIGRSARRATPATRSGDGARFLAAAVTLAAFISATFFVLPPHSAAQFAAFPALAVAACYTVIGLWYGARWSIAGVVLGACTLGGFALLTAHFNLWMAVAGGGTLLLTGAWLRRA